MKSINLTLSIDMVCVTSTTFLPIPITSFSIETEKVVYFSVFSPKT